jgi:twitching motility protein PilT
LLRRTTVQQALLGVDAIIMRSATDVSFDLAAALITMVENGGSDLLVKVGNRPLVRVDGVLDSLEGDDGEELEPWETEALLHELLPQAKIKEFEDTHEVDFAYSVPSLARFRVSAYMQRGSVSIAFRVIPYSVKSIKELGLPDVVRRLADEHRGVILVTGTTSSGKSTTLAAMIEHINLTTRKHVVTIEDPIEYLHSDKRAAIDQREVGADTGSFQSALRRVLRQDPDVILIGEMRDEETVRTALAAAETGHMVLSTLHTLNAAESVNRIIDFFAPREHEHVRAMLAGTLKGIISQRLVPRADGTGRVPVCEILTSSARIHDAILDPETNADLGDIISDGAYYGMQTFDQALFQALKAGDVGMEEALSWADHPHDFKLLVAAEGNRTTTMDHLREAAAGGSADQPSSPFEMHNNGRKQDLAPPGWAAASPGSALIENGASHD